MKNANVIANVRVMCQSCLMSINDGINMNNADLFHSPNTSVSRAVLPVPSTPRFTRVVEHRSNRSLVCAIPCAEYGVPANNLHQPSSFCYPNVNLGTAPTTNFLANYCHALNTCGEAKGRLDVQKEWIIWTKKLKNSSCSSCIAPASFIRGQHSQTTSL